MTKDDSLNDAHDGDDLTVIKGIGPARQRWLADVLDVHSFVDLAALSADDIEAALKTEKQPMVARPDIDAWLAQAKERAADTASEPDQHAVSEPSMPDRDSGAGALQSSHDWRPFGSFVVEYRRRQIEGQPEDYQTSVHHIEDDSSEVWPGLDSKVPWQWMLGRAKEGLVPQADDVSEPEAPPADLILPAGTDIAIRVSELHLRQPIRTEEHVVVAGPEQMTSGFVRSGEPFALDILFELVGSAADDIAGRAMPYSGELYARDLSTGDDHHLGNVLPGRLSEGDMSYKASLHWAKLPKGAYRFQALVLVQSSPPIPGHIQGSVVQVM